MVEVLGKIVKISPEIDPRVDEVKLTKAEECHKEWLYDQYWNQGRTLKEIVTECGVVESTPWKWMKKFNIPIRPSRFIKGHKTNVGLKFSPELIEARYRDENNPRWKGGQISYYRKKTQRVWTKYWREKTPRGYYIHHIDCDVSNNDICNLALVTHSFHQVMHHLRRKRMEKNKLLPESWLYKIADDIRNLKKSQYQESYNESLDDIITKIARKFQDLGIDIYLDEEWSF